MKTQPGANPRWTISLPGCTKRFKYDGKSRIKHEKAHAESPQPPQVTSSSTNPESTEPNQPEDDMFNYQCSLLQHGLLYLNFRDAVAERGWR